MNIMIIFLCASFQFLERENEMKESFKFSSRKKKKNEEEEERENNLFWGFKSSVVDLYII